MNILYLIRHGKTLANEQHLYCGSTDLPLSETGKQELRKLHYTIPVPCIYLTSGMQRTDQTLKLLFGNVQYQIDTRFREIDFGVFELKSYDDLKENPAYQEWISGDNEQKCPPKGESAIQMKHRVLEGYKNLIDLLEHGDNHIVLVTHGGVIASLMEYLFPYEYKNRYQWQPQPGYGYEINHNSYKELVPNENII